MKATPSTTRNDDVHGVGDGHILCNNCCTHQGRYYGFILLWFLVGFILVCYVMVIFLEAIWHGYVSGEFIFGVRISIDTPELERAKYCWVNGFVGCAFGSNFVLLGM